MSVTETCFFGGEQLNLPSLRQLSFHFVFVNKQPIFLSQWPFSLSSWKLVSATVFLPKNFSPAAGWLIYELHLGIIFSLKKAVWIRSLWQVFSNLVSPPQVKKFGENTVAETSFRNEQRKRSLRQKNWKFNFFLKNEKKKKYKKTHMNHIFMYN